MKNLRLTSDFFRPSAMPKAGGYFAALFLGLGSGMGFIQKLLGHGSSKTTEIYVPITKKGFEKTIPCCLAIRKGELNNTQ